MSSQPGAGVGLGGGGRRAEGFVRDPVPAPREAASCALAQDGGFFGRMRPRALQKTCKGSAVETSEGDGTVMLPVVGPRSCQEMGTGGRGVTRTPCVAYQVSPSLGILSLCSPGTMVSPGREPASCLAGRADPKLRIL